MLDAIGMKEINQIFEVIDAMGVHREHVVIPGHEERRITDTQVNVPPLTGYGPGGPVHIPGGDRPPAELRQFP